MECALNNYLEQHVEVPTRDKNILDLILSSPSVPIENIDVACPIGNSDHGSVNFEIRVPDIRYQWQKEKIDFRRGRYKPLREHLKEIDWDSKFQGKGASEMWESFHNEMMRGVTKYIPKVERNNYSRSMWMTKQIRNALNAKNRSWRRYQLMKTTAAHGEYLSAIKHATGSVRKAKRKLEIRIAKNIKNDPKAFYRYAKDKLKYRDTVPDLINENGHPTMNDMEAATLLNRYFSTVFNQESDINFEVNKIEPTQPSEIPLIARETVERYLLHLNEGKSAGVDDLPPILLRRTAKAIADPLTKIFQESLNSGQIPMDWKNANVTPIHKKGSKKNVANYRPISLTSQVCRIFERIIKEEITMYLDTNKLITESQHGFVTGKSCLTNLLMYLELVTSSVDANKPVDAIYLDFSKAFDTVPHKRLIKKLESLKINDTIIVWIQNWLAGRKQRVVLRGARSEWLPVISGVPQGSVLGPLLFLIYINDIDEEVSSPILKFADDTKILRPLTSTNDHEELQKDLDKLHRWSLKWEMKFNASKCKVIHFGHNNPQFPYIIEGQILEKSSQEKDLGITMQPNLDFDKHIGIITGRANKILGMISRSYDNKQKNNILQLYKTLVRPHLEYAVQAWRPYKQKHLNLIESVQRRATKMVEGLHQMPYEDRLSACGLISLEMRRRRADLIEVFKMVNGIEPLPVDRFFTIQTTKATRGHSKKIFKPRARLNLRKNFFSHRVVDSWNALSEEAVNSSSVNTFKSHITPIFNLNRGLVTSQRWLPAPVSTSSRS